MITGTAPQSILVRAVGPSLAGFGVAFISRKTIPPAEAKIAVAPGIGFGDYGDDHVRIALIENEHRLRQAARGIRDMFRKDGLR